MKSILDIIKSSDAKSSYTTAFSREFPLHHDDLTYHCRLGTEVEKDVFVLGAIGLERGGSSQESTNLSIKFYGLAPFANDGGKTALHHHAALLKRAVTVAKGYIPESQKGKTPVMVFYRENNQELSRLRLSVKCLDMRQWMTGEDFSAIASASASEKVTLLVTYLRQRRNPGLEFLKMSLTQLDIVRKTVFQVAMSAERNPGLRQPNPHPNRQPLSSSAPFFVDTTDYTKEMLLHQLDVFRSIDCSYTNHLGVQMLRLPYGILPEGWYPCYSKRWSRPYFINYQTGCLTWNLSDLTCQAVISSSGSTTKTSVVGTATSTMEEEKEEEEDLPLPVTTSQPPKGNFGGLLLPPKVAQSYSRLTPIAGVEVREITNPSHLLHKQKGVFCIEDISKDALIGHYVGEAMWWEMVEIGAYIGALPGQQARPLPRGLSRRGWTSNLVVDAYRWGNEMRYINDYRKISKGPNVKFDEGLRKAPTGLALWPVRALRDISKGEELLLDYGEGYWENLKASCSSNPSSSSVSSATCSSCSSGSCFSSFMNWEKIPVSQLLALHKEFLPAKDSGVSVNNGKAVAKRGLCPDELLLYGAGTFVEEEQENDTPSTNTEGLVEPQLCFYTDNGAIKRLRLNLNQLRHFGDSDAPNCAVHPTYDQCGSLVLELKARAPIPKGEALTLQMKSPSFSLPSIAYLLPPTSPLTKETCCKCRKVDSDGGRELALCKGRHCASMAWHLSCLKLRKESLPDPWFCPFCVHAGMAYR